MPNLYIYFIASLPGLDFTGQPPFSLESFLERCDELLPAKDAGLIRGICSGEPQDHPAINKWLSFDTTLRNELVRIRSGHRKTEAARYLRPDGYAGTAIYHIALAAQRSHSLLEGEKILDRARWDFLDELLVGHYFDLDFLIIYAYKLLILERWGKINRADKKRLLEEVIRRS